MAISEACLAVFLSFLLFLSLLLFETESCFVPLAGLLTSSDPHTLASQSAGITGVSHCGPPELLLRMYSLLLSDKGSNCISVFLKFFITGEKEML